MTQAEYLISRFGAGGSAVARALGLAPSVVQGWKERGVVPACRMPEIIEAGRSLDPPIEHRDFFEQLDGTPHVFRRAPAESSETA